MGPPPPAPLHIPSALPYPPQPPVPASFGLCFPHLLGWSNLSWSAEDVPLQHSHTGNLHQSNSWLGLCPEHICVSGDPPILNLGLSSVVDLHGIIVIGLSCHLISSIFMCPTGILYFVSY